MRTQKVIVVGSGLMAPGITAAFLDAGMAVTLAGRSMEKVYEATSIARGLTSRSKVLLYAGALAPATFAHADLVVETIVEDGREKRDLLAVIESWVPAGTVIASNTSSISIGHLASALRRPELLGGLHFLNPAHLTNVVEVVVPEATSPRVSNTLLAAVYAMGKSPIVIRSDLPGFVWNRLQAALLRECLHLVDEGVANAAMIDLAVSEGLAPRWLAAGPLGTADLGGIETFSRMAHELFPYLSNSTVPTSVMTGEHPSGSFYGWDTATKNHLLVLRDDAVREGSLWAARRRNALNSQ